MEGGGGKSGGGVGGSEKLKGERGEREKRCELLDSPPSFSVPSSPAAFLSSASTMGIW